FLSLFDLHSLPTRRSSDLREFSVMSCRARSWRWARSSRVMGLASAVRDFKVAMDCGKEASLVPCPAVNAIRGPDAIAIPAVMLRSEEHTSELQSRENLVCR